MAWFIGNKGLSNLVFSLVKKEFISQNVEWVLDWCINLNWLMDKVIILITQTEN